MGVFAWSHSSPSWRTWRLEGGQCCPLEFADVVSLMLVGKGASLGPLGLFSLPSWGCSGLPPEDVAVGQV